MGRASGEKFWHLPRDLLTRLLKFELLHNNVLQAVGKLCVEKRVYQWGGPFLRRAVICAHCGVSGKVENVRDWGDLDVSEDGYMFWSRGALWFSLAQFQDNALMATDLPSGANTSLLHEIRGTRWSCGI